MATLSLKIIYPVTVRIFFIALFGLLLYAQPFFIWDEGYQENYYTGLNIGFTFGIYLLRYPTEIAMPIALVMALPGLIFRKKIGWIAGFALVMCITIAFFLDKYVWDLSFFFRAVLFACFIVMFVQLKDHFEIKRKHLMWAGALVMVYMGLMIIEHYGGFLGRSLPAS